LGTIPSTRSGFRGFQRIHLRPGKKTTVTFTLTPESLALWNEDMKFVVEPGIFDLLLGTSSAKTQAILLKLTAK
jgi:beta-glucosidase